MVLIFNEKGTTYRYFEAYIVLLVTKIVDIETLPLPELAAPGHLTNFSPQCFRAQTRFYSLYKLFAANSNTAGPLPIIHIVEHADLVQIDDLLPVAAQKLRGWKFICKIPHDEAYSAMTRQWKHIKKRRVLFFQTIKIKNPPLKVNMWVSIGNSF